MGKIIKFKTLYQKNFELMEKTQKKQKHPIFNGEWEILSSLGEGNTSKVYLCRSLKDHKQQIALKLLREEFLNRDEHSIKSVEQEIQILHGLNHMNIVNIKGYGSDGHVKKPSGREIKNLVYIYLEYFQAVFCLTSAKQWVEWEKME